MTPGISRTQASISASAAISPPDSTKSPSETSSSLRAAISRSSTPSKRPQTMTAPGRCASCGDARLRQRRAARAHQQARALYRRERRRARAPARRPSSPCRDRRRPACRRRCGACRWRDRGCRWRRATRCRPSALPARLCPSGPGKHFRKNREYRMARHIVNRRPSPRSPPAARRRLCLAARSIFGTVVVGERQHQRLAAAERHDLDNVAGAEIMHARARCRACAPSAVTASSPIRSA